MFVYTYSHNNHKLFFSYKKRTFENLFPSQKKKKRWCKGFEASYPSLYTLQVQSPPCHSNELFFPICKSDQSIQVFS